PALRITYPTPRPARRGIAPASRRGSAPAPRRGSAPPPRRGRLEDDVTTTRRGHARRLDEGTPCVGFCPVASALDDVDGEAALRCLRVLRGHVRAGLARRRGHLGQAGSGLTVARQRHPRALAG